MPPEIVRAPDRYVYLDTLTKRGVVSPVERIGPVPGILHLRILELTQQVREYAASHAMTNVDALRAGMQEKSEEFRRKGEIYVKS